MKAILLEEFGGAEKLKLKEIPTPQPADDEVQIQIAYTSVNPVDWKIREGLLKGRLPHEFPVVPGWDASGTVTAIGKKVKRFRAGDEVFAYCRKPTIHLGTYAEFVCFEANNVVLKPKNITFAQAAAVPLTALTAWQALFDTAHLKAGETILIQAGAGGVGGMAIQLAKNKGAKVYTTASRQNHDYVKKLGAEAVFDYHQDFTNELKKLAPQGVDVVFDCVGGKTLFSSFPLLKPGGRLVSIVEQIDPALAKQHNVKADFVFVSPNADELKQIADLISEKKIFPPEIEEMRLTDAAIAQEKNRAGHTRGKIVLKVK